MPIVITPSGEYVDDQTGMPVDPKMIQQLDPQSTARQGEMMGGAVVPQILDPRSVVREGEMARENIPPNLDMGMDSMMPQNIDPRSVVREGERAAAELSDVDKVRMLIDMGLSPQEAMEAIAREKARPTIAPQEFGRVVDMQGGQQMADPMMQQQQMADPMMRQQQMGALPMAMPTPRGSTNMGMPEDAMVAQRMNQVDTSGMSPQQIEMLRMGIDPFAEGMIGR